MQLASGDVFADYTVVEALGAGGMGEVYLARHPRLPRRDALKILPAGISKDPIFRERFIREADLASGLWHPNVVSVCTTAASTPASCGSRWNSSTAPTPHVNWVTSIRPVCR
jgi:serine/threonine protein kinase